MRKKKTFFRSISLSFFLFFFAAPAESQSSAKDYGKCLAAVGVIGASELHRREKKGKESRNLGQILQAQCKHCWKKDLATETHLTV